MYLKVLCATGPTCTNRKHSFFWRQRWLHSHRRWPWRGRKLLCMRRHLLCYWALQSPILTLQWRRWKRQGSRIAWASGSWRAECQSRDPTSLSPKIWHSNLRRRSRSRSADLLSGNENFSCGLPNFSHFNTRSRTSCIVINVGWIHHFGCFDAEKI